MANFTVYGFCLIVSASLVALLSMSTDFFVQWVNDIVIPCQHDSVWTGVSCNCDNTRGVYGGAYCDECQCAHQGICSMSSKGDSRWGCLCPSHKKWTGTLCDNCYAVDHNASLNECTGPCLNSSTHQHFGPKCDTVCVPRGSSGDSLCREIASGGGVCNACNGHGACGPTGTCECDDGWFNTLGGEQCALSCETAGIDCPEDRGICRSIGGELQCVCAPGYYGRDCDLTCKSVNDVPCSGHGTCGLSALGVPACTCDTHYAGDMCQHECPGDKSFPTPCSGHGQCTLEVDRHTQKESAICTCNKNSLWEGFDCSCNARFSCSGHGSCNADATCQCNDWGPPDELTHQHFAGEACQKCKKHWYGIECHLRCDPDGKYEPDEFADGRQTMRDGVDIGCNGFGTCDVIPTALGERVQCSCRGTDPTWFCAKCEANYYPLTSVKTAEAYCTNECNEGTCSFRGICNDEYDGTNDICICNTVSVGTVDFDTIDPVQFCSTCKPNWFPDEMNSQAPCTHYCADDGQVEGRIIVFGEDRLLQGDENAQNVCAKVGDGWSPDPDCRVCSGKGTCQGDGECRCDDGVTGMYCEIDCGTTANGLVCNGHGRCKRNDLDMWFDPFTNEYRCECQPYDTYTSETRQRLLKRGFQVEPPPNPNFYGKYCEFHCPRYNEEICAGRGECAIGIVTPEKSDPAKDLKVGEPKKCSKDSECSGIPGAFCAQMSSPWDSLMSGTKSFFSSGPESPGYFTCATSQNCLDSIYSIPWDDYCVNMLNGWYPDVLNTASCTYHIDENANCRERVENFFINTYKNTDKTWCESALEEMTPFSLVDNDPAASENTTVQRCSRTTHASEELFNVYDELCHTWELRSACDASPECIYDQTTRYIEATDVKCSELTIVEGKCCSSEGVCHSECSVNVDGTGCDTKTYCRARDCQDAIIDNNIESLCVSVDPPVCPVQQTDWSSYCTETTGELRHLSEMSVRDTFYSCIMYENSVNPQTVRARVPGGVDIYGELSVSPEENVPIQQYRASAIASRTLLNSATHCGKALSEINFGTNGFCAKHLEHVEPSWYTHKSEVANWFKEYMVICSPGIEGIYTNAAAAEDKAALLQKECTVEYKCQNRLNPSWDATCADVDSEADVSAWTLKCLTSGDTPFDIPDWSAFPEDVSDCTLHENTLVTRWGASKWDINDVISKYTDNCKRGLDASWIPKETPIPRICDMGACAEGHTCVPCSADTMECHDGVVCIATNNVNCFEDQPCQNGGECYQFETGTISQSSNKYLCEWREPTPVNAYVNGVEYPASVSSRNILIVPEVLEVVTGSVVVVKNNTWSVMEDPFVFIDEDTRIPWTAPWKNCSAFFCPFTAACVSECSKCGNSAHGNMCSGVPVQLESSSPVLPRDIESCRADDNFNWYAYCSGTAVHNKRNQTLSTSAANGLNVNWSGHNIIVGPESLLLTEASANVAGQLKVIIDVEASDPDASLVITIDDEETVWHVSGEVFGYTDFVRTYRTASNQLEIMHRKNSSAFIGLKAMFGRKLVLKSLLLDGVPQMNDFVDTLDKNRFYLGREDNVTNYESWSFAADGTSTIYRTQNEVHPPTKQCAIEMSDNTTVKVCGAGEMPTNGQRWSLDMAYEKRIHGWAKIQDTRAKTANMDVYNADFSPIVRLYVYQQRLYVNDVATECRVETLQWWHWTIDMHAVNESIFVTSDELVINEFLIVDEGQTLFRQSWDISVRIGDCTFDATHELVTTAHEKSTPGLMSTHFHHVTATPKHVCRAHCHGHKDCRQWSWTPSAQDCYLHAKPCHEGGCTLGSHTVNTFHARGVSYFDIWTSAKNTKVSWNHIRAEDLIAAPFTCPIVDVESAIPEKWRGPFEALYEPLEVDATSICNALHTMWEPLPGYKTGNCGPSGTCPYTTSVAGCATYIDHAEPSVDSVVGCENDKELFLNLDWTSYCRYERSFYDGMPFLGGRDIFVDDKTMAGMCATVDAVRQDASDKCTQPVNSEWFGNCFERTSAYEEFCSNDCIAHIESMLDDVPGDPSICSIRKGYLDISDIGLDDQCECSLNNLIVTDFCMSQNAYHVGNSVKVPELYNSDCSRDCQTTLQDSMDRSAWRTWCEKLSMGVIPGTCAKTICECDLSERGVAGERCELSCPPGIDDGVELACSGRNGRCFAVNEEEITEDIEKQQLNGEYRNASFVGSTVPIWQRGPVPTAGGRCQCALGSGASCSIPCDKCNNGTYGAHAASQYGICDSFNGICRGLAPWMRYNFVKAAEEGGSPNTTAFENALGAAKWSFPDRFVFESDETVLDYALQYLRDEDGYYKTSISEPVLEEEDHMAVIFDVFEELCWIPTFSNVKYLNNDASVENDGLTLGIGTMKLKSTELEESGLCTVITYSSDLTLCYSEGKMYARDNDIRLFVIEKGNTEFTLTETSYLEDITFTVHNDGNIYAFGGQWNYGTTVQKMNTVYKISVQRVGWMSNGIVVLTWSEVSGSGRAPDGQVFAPIAVIDNSLYVLSRPDKKYTMFALELPTPISTTGSWSTFDVDVPGTGYVKHMESNGAGQLNIYFATETYLFTPEAAVPFVLDAGKHTSKTITEREAPFAKATQDCSIELSYVNDTTVLRVAEQPVVRALALKDTVRIYISEWMSVDTSTRAALTSRFLETVDFDADMDPVDLNTLTEKKKLQAIELVERVHMHQARWTADDMFFAKTKVVSRIWSDESMFRHVPIDSFVFTPGFESVFDTLSLGVFAQDIQSSPTKLSIVVEGNEPRRRILIQGNYVDEEEGYLQKFYLGIHKMAIYLEWSASTLRIKLSKEGASDGGYVRWLLPGQPSRTFVLSIALEDWLRNGVDMREQETYRHAFSDKVGRLAMFNLFVSREVSYTYSMMKQTSDFLAYSSSHCATTASSQCPGTIPYINLPCSGRGRCNIACQCVCEVAPSLLQTSDTALQNAQRDESPFRGKGCEITCPGYDGNDLNSICSGRGTCQYDGSCACPQGYTGDACQFKCPIDEEQSICSGHGGCGTRATEMSSFVFNNNNYMDTITANNKKNYVMALSSFYSACYEHNYISQWGVFKSDVNVANGDFDERGPAFAKCEEINLNIRQNLQLNRDEEFRDYPYGMCIGVTEELPNYFVVTLRKPIAVPLPLDAIPMFECQAADCTFEASETNDNSIRGLETKLLAPSFEIKMKYVHGSSSGMEHYEVNGKDFYIKTTWTPYAFRVDFLNTDGFDNTTLIVDDPVIMFKLVVEDKKASYKVFKDYFPSASETERLFVAPMFEHKYVKLVDPLDGYVLVEDLPYLQLDTVEYACDMEPLCTGIIQWDEPFRENLYSLHSRVDNVDGFDSYKMPENMGILYAKMSLVYQGRDAGTGTSKCDTISGKRAKYPTVEFTETYDIPIEDIDLSLAKDDETPSIVIGKGLWTQCWERVTATSKIDCYEKAKEANTFGFAYSEDEGVCLVYYQLTDATRIKLGRYNSESRLNIFHPCNSENTYWRPTQ